ncbi:UDP-N-acetylglucosamine 4,6-dehydratase (inverting) [bacterium]|nr:UDP-N-acetylglucosamine 4,6-dehydratase (inverting) [bacterium]
MNWTDKTVLITGGTGSFGKKFTEIMLNEYQPKKLIIFSRDELKQHEMRVNGFEHESLRYFIGDVRDAARLRRAFNGVDVVVHAAAMKQVPACEYNPIEAVETNINGARNVIDAALDQGVQRVLAMSTDKATGPVNLYGATKLVSEKLFVQANAYRGERYPARFACVRYGNVVGSRGSVVPLFRKQRETGTLTITDDRMTRFWITLDQGVRFVINSLEIMHGGEVFVPKLPSMRLVDLARAMAPECEIKLIGIRPGEKLHEAMVTEDEGRHTVDAGDRYVILPPTSWWPRENWSNARHLADGFSYASDTNESWLDAQGILQMIDENEPEDGMPEPVIHQNGHTNGAVKVMG